MRISRREGKGHPEEKDTTAAQGRQGGHACPEGGGTLPGVMLRWPVSVPSSPATAAVKNCRDEKPPFRSDKGIMSAAGGHSPQPGTYRPSISSFSWPSSQVPFSSLPFTLTPFHRRAFPAIMRKICYFFFLPAAFFFFAILFHPLSS
jgi:hypothetical protein